MEHEGVVVQVGAQVPSLQPVQKYQEVGACNGVRLHFPGLVLQPPVLVVFATEVAVEAHSPLRIDPLQIVLEVDLRLSTGAHS